MAVGYLLRDYIDNETCREQYSVTYTIAKIHSEIFEQLKLLPPNTVLDIDFDRHKSDFLLLTKHNRNCILKMESCELLTRLVDMDEEITAEIDSVSISGRSMLYPVHRVKMVYYSCRLM